MTGVEAIAALGSSGVSPSDALGSSSALGSALPHASPSSAGQVGFGDLLTKGLARAEQKVDAADSLVRAFALDDSVPVHQVTIALEEARLAVDLAMQVRTRLVEAYKEIMNTQL